MTSTQFFYDETRKLLEALLSVPERKHKELSELLGYDYSPELFNDLTLSLMAFSKLLSDYYVKSLDDLAELQEVSK